MSRRKGIAIAAVIALGTGGATAATDTDTLQVTVTVQSACSLSSSTLDFGTYTAGQTNNLDGESSLNYANCIGNLTFELDGGQSGNPNDRRMKKDDNSVGYQLYRNSSRTNVFSTGGNAKTLSLAAMQSGSIPVFGRIPSGQIVPPGAYTDTINITLTF